MEEVKHTCQKAFFENDYAWAKPYISGKTNFQAIEEAAGMSPYTILHLRLQQMSFYLYVVNDHFLHLYADYKYHANMKLFREIYNRFGESVSEEKGYF